MTATNHAITGAALAVYIQSPIALPLALASHFVLDSLPHFGLEKKNRTFIAYLVIDIALVGLLSLFFLMYDPAQAWFIVLAMFLGTAPDLVWAYRWRYEAKTGIDPIAKLDPISKLHSKIQWFQKPIGIVFELVWFVGMSAVIAQHIA